MSNAQIVFRGAWVAGCAVLLAVAWVVAFGISIAKEVIEGMRKRR